jgi:hypothetical protein
VGCIEGNRKSDHLEELWVEDSANDNWYRVGPRVAVNCTADQPHLPRDLILSRAQLCERPSTMVWPLRKNLEHVIESTMDVSHKIMYLTTMCTLIFGSNC